MTSNKHPMDIKSLELLEFPCILDIIAGYTSFSTSRHMVLGLTPSSDFETVSSRLARSTEARRLLEVEPSMNVEGARDVTSLVQNAARGKLLDPQQLLDVFACLGTSRKTRALMVRHASTAPLLSALAGEITELKKLETEIAATINPAGDVLSTASPELSRIRSQLKFAREQLIKQLESIIKSDSGQKVLQEAIITQREGRFVVPVKVEHKKELKGIVHDVSNTGATIFIEPWATVETGNEYKQLEIEQQREIERILARLSQKIGSHCQEIALNIEILARIDVELAKARYAEAAGAVEPQISRFEQDRSLWLERARHPLLKGKAVPLDLRIGKEYTALVITGPNTGGKTVALKTVGLLSLMVQSGIPIPADAASRMPVFDLIFADIGDEQSIEQTLSSFSWHMSNVGRIIREATVASLVLMDELGTSTDPVEGSALAASVLTFFLQKGTTTIATSHFNELKAMAHKTTGLQNAAFEFDPETLAPTFRLITGVPGGSNALATASRLGIPADIIENARQRLNSQARELDSLLFDLSNEQNRVRRLRDELSLQNREAARMRQELERRIEEVGKQQQAIIDRARDETVREISGLTRELKSATSLLRKDHSKKQIEVARNSLRESRQKLKNILEGQSETTRPSTGNQEISIGDVVWLKDMEMEARIVAINKAANQVTAEEGSCRFTISMDRISRQTPDRRPRPQPVKARPVLPACPHVSMELDLRGRRAEEVEWLLESYLNDASLANLETARIIHGHGSGVVKQIVREYVASQPLVKSFRPGGRGEGGDGVTVINLT